MHPAGSDPPVSCLISTMVEYRCPGMSFREPIGKQIDRILIDWLVTIANTRNVVVIRWVIRIDSLASISPYPRPWLDQQTS